MMVSVEEHHIPDVRDATAQEGGAENSGQDIAGQDNDGQEKRHA